MHRDLSITVDPDVTERVLRELEQRDGVVSLSVRRGESVKPPGDVISASVLNGDADAVLRIVMESSGERSVSIATSSLDSLIDSESHPLVRGDVDEVTWEEADTATRRHSRPTVNFFVTVIGGGVIASAGLSASSQVTEATALVAAAIIAPVFEPLARLSLGIVNRRSSIVSGALLSVALGYVTLIVAALVTMLLLRACGHGYADEFLHSSTVHEVQYPPTLNLILSAAGALTGVIMIAAGRFTQLAGPLVALQLLPAGASIGVALELGKGAIAARSLGRLAIDIGMVVLAGLIVFAYKHVTVHEQRRTLFH